MQNPRSVLEYYQKRHFNPVPISLDDRSSVASHFAKRLNLYQRHLGIPLSLFRGRSVIEFGCNTGESALVLAAFGANLTLVEPNELMIPNIEPLFKKFGLSDRIVALSSDGIESFNAPGEYDVVIAEGFLYTLQNRDEVFRTMVDLLAPGGIAVISSNDRYGLLAEMIRKVILFRGCRLMNIDDVHSETSLSLAKRLFFDDFSNLNASRPFDAWFKDQLLNPFVASKYFWSYPELIPLIESTGCEFYASSPIWRFNEHFNWYKNTVSAAKRHQDLLTEWRRMFSYMLTGIKPTRLDMEPVSDHVIGAVDELISGISAYTAEDALPDTLPGLIYPAILDDYLSSLDEPIFRKISEEMKALFEAVQGSDAEELIEAYHTAQTFRNLWGAAYHYLAFIKSVDLPLK